MEYRREIDGLRSLAVLPVIFFHAGFQVFSGGYLGVDIFFVISGYLITSLILHEHRAGKFSIVRFYERRARRILPALFLVMLTCLPFAWLWLLPKDLRSFSQSLVAVCGFSSNILFWRTTDYFDTASELKPLLHTWSLAVEEQYYLIFPLALSLAWRLGKRWIVALLVLTSSISLYAAIRGTTHNPVATFYLLPARSWELLLGALVAFYLFERTPNRNVVVTQAGSIVGLLLIVYAVCGLDRNVPFPILYTLVPTIGTALIVLFCTQQTWVGKLLGCELLVSVGLISFSAYLWHQPLFAFARHRSLYEPSTQLLTALAAVSLVLAYFSWKYVEAPFRNRQKIRRKQIVALVVCGNLLFVTVGLAGHATRGFPNRMPKAAQLAEIDLPLIENGWCFYSIDTERELTLGQKGVECWLGDKAASTKGVLFGDSYAGSYEPLWSIVGEKSHLNINAITTNWCHPSLDQEFTGDIASRALQQCLFNREYLKKNLSHYDFAVFAANWEPVLAQEKMAGVLRLIDVAAAKVKVVLVMPTPKHYDSDVTSIYRRSLLYRSTFNIGEIGNRSDIRYREANSLLEKAVQRYNNVLFVDRDSLFRASDANGDRTKDGIPVSLDGGHLSIPGARDAAASFLRSNSYRDFVSRLR